jgi:hypothetical protein
MREVVPGVFDEVRERRGHVLPESGRQIVDGRLDDLTQLSFDARLSEVVRLERLDKREEAVLQKHAAFREGRDVQVVDGLHQLPPSEPKRGW